MSERKRGAAAFIDIDALLQDTWLQVISLRHGPQFQDGEGARCGSAALLMSNAFSVS
jgi:hypothetical protein